jgi:CBS domain-containing protein
MKIDRLYTRSVVATTPLATVGDAAAAMNEFKVGALLVMDDANPSARPVGVVTDRDLAMDALIPGGGFVGSVMTPIVATIGRDADTHEALETMRAHGVRRLGVTTHDGSLCGVLSIDDVVDGLSAELATAAAVLKGTGANKEVSR